MKKLAVLIFNLVVSCIAFGQIQIGPDITESLPPHRFGESVSISADGKRVVVGMPREYGKVFVYEEIGSQWLQVGTEISGKKNHNNEQFGHTVSISANGKRIVIGAISYAVIYEEANGHWIKVGNYLDQSLGNVVAISDDGKRIVLGDPFNNDLSSNSGCVKVFEDQNGNWTQVNGNLYGTIINGSITSYFGKSVSINLDGSIVAVGAPGSNQSISNKVDVFEDINGAWINIGVLEGSKTQRESFGESISLSSSGDRLIVGAPKKSFNNNFALGQATIFEFVGGNWKQMGGFIDGVNVGDNLGYSVSLSNNGKRSIVGSVGVNGGGGKIQVYEYKDSIWNPIRHPLHGSYTATLGSSVSSDALGTKMAVGSPNRGKTQIFYYPFVEGKVFFDEDLNCLQNPIEYELEGINLIINPGNYNCSTDIRGDWFLDSLPVGNYTLSLGNNSQPIFTNCNLPLNFSVNQTNCLTSSPAIGLLNKKVVGEIFFDGNEDCIKDTSEIGLAEIAVTINPGNYRTITNLNGKWFMDSLPNGNYTVTLDSSKSWYFNCNNPYSFTISNQSIPTFLSPFGAKFIQVEGSVYFDENIDCNFDTIESGIELIELSIEPGSIIVRSDQNGKFNIPFLSTGAYTVSLSPNEDVYSICNLPYSFSITSPLTQIQLAPIGIKNIGITGKVFENQNSNCFQETNEFGLSQVPVTINPGNIIVQTNQNGQWFLDSLPNGSYTSSIDLNCDYITDCNFTQSFIVMDSLPLTSVPSIGLTPIPGSCLTWNDIAPIFTNNGCINCHNSNNKTAGLSFSNYVPDFTTYKNSAFHAGKTYCGTYYNWADLFLAKLDGTLNSGTCGTPMPPGIPYGVSSISNSDLQSIKCWIKSGATNNCDDNCIINPSIQQGDIKPAPLNNGGKGIMQFSMLENLLFYKDFTNNPIILNICLQNAIPLNGINAISGSFRSNFDWSYDASLNCLSGTQVRGMNGSFAYSNNGGLILVDFIVTNPIQCPFNQIGFEAELIPPACASGINNTVDDIESVYTCLDNTILYANLLVQQVSSCNVNNGTATTTSFNGTPPYTYLWNTGDTTSTIQALGPAVYQVTVTDALGAIAYAKDTITAPCPPLYINPKVFLESKYSSTLSTLPLDLANKGYLTLQSPFGDYKFIDTSFNTSYMVDWVEIELRDAQDPTIIVASSSFLLFNGGLVHNVDGNTAALYAPAGTYHIAIRHRNHLPVMTANTFALSSNPTTIDFTTEPLYGTNAAKTINGLNVLHSGDANGDGRVNAADRSMIWNDRNLTGYLDTDLNLDGVCNAADRSIVWNNRNLIEQLP